jgi:conjugative relaxase-like TrwC/TraI family protein
MLTISKPLSAGQAHQYHAEEFQNGRDNYYTQRDRIAGTWHGRLASEWGLVGEVHDEDFRRLAEGQHPVTGDQLVRHQTPRRTTNDQGTTVTTMEHRAGWDATFSAPKTVSLTALVGGDARIRDAHEASVDVALDALEQYVQARLGGNETPETTGNWVAAKFQHDSARPVDGYAAPQLHTHVVVFNLTEAEEGRVRPLQPRELYKSQQYATAVYRSELATRLSALGYEIERGRSGQPEIVGYSADYVEASSPRRTQIEAHLASAHRQGAAAAQIAAHQTREPKRDLTRDEVQRQHQSMAAGFGDQPARVVSRAGERGLAREDDRHQISANAALSFAVARNFEREAVVDERTLTRDALVRSMGDRTVAEIQAEFTHRVETGGLLEIAQRPGVPGRSFTTPETIELERDTVRLMRDGQETLRPLVDKRTRCEIQREHSNLNAGQRDAVEQILANRDRVQALEGIAGAGKTTAVAAVRDAAERDGYTVEGFAPTSRAAHQLREAGIPSDTLQRHLIRDPPVEHEPRLYVLDESSLASTVQMHEFLRRLGAHDRVLLVGDIRQHHAVDAGEPFRQLQVAGIAVARLDDIVRQRDPELRVVIERLAAGDARGALEQLDRQGRVHEVAETNARFQAIAKEYLSNPEGTLVVSPDNESRTAINRVIHAAMQDAGYVSRTEHQISVLVPRQDVTGADRQWAEKYEVGNLVRYAKGSSVIGVNPGEFGRLTHTNPKDNLVTVTREDGSPRTYDPRRLQGVTLFREADRAFAVGDRVQFTAPDRVRDLANRQLGVVEGIDAGTVQIRLDSGKAVTLPKTRPLHLDHAYAVTSHSSQGQTADRVLVHVDTVKGGEHLVNRRLAYVAVSRGRFDAQIYTDDKQRLVVIIGRDVSRRTATEISMAVGNHQRTER